MWWHTTPECRAGRERARLGRVQELRAAKSARPVLVAVDRETAARVTARVEQRFTDPVVAGEVLAMLGLVAA